MHDPSDEDSADDRPRECKKRKLTGRMSDATKLLRACSHALGPDCECKKFQCFKKIPDSEKNRILREFNQLADHNRQSLYLSGLITVHPVARRRPRTNGELSNEHIASYSYKVRVRDEEGVLTDQPICKKAFISLHGVSQGRVQRICESLTLTGAAPIDKRGSHHNRPRKLAPETLEKVLSFIRSMDGKKPECSSTRQSKKMQPSDSEVSVCRLHKMYVESHPENRVSYDKFREIFEDFQFFLLMSLQRHGPKCDKTNVEISSTNRASCDNESAETLSVKRENCDNLCKTSSTE